MGDTVLHALTRIISYVPWFGPRKPRPPTEPPQLPSGMVDGDKLAQHLPQDGGVLSSLARIISFFSWSGHQKPSPSTEPSPEPLPHIAEAFREYIRNHIPARLIDTSNYTFVERDQVYDIFSSKVAEITDEDVQRRMDAIKEVPNPESAVYVSACKIALHETIRDVVQYAIFSHRWTNSEPSYKDFPGLALSSSYGRQCGAKIAGVDKLIHVCDTARKLGYRLVWSDTCCIDRTNTTELSEAIHAMFKWYAYAHVCIVHLGTSSSLSDFGREPWFERGWTLQELLAPRRIKFYDKEWRPFTDLANDKYDHAFMSRLSTVTMIPQEVITTDNTRGIKGRSTWEIMSWAASRKTMRLEDSAYSLLGLFDVHIPIAYGEGEKAFPRLVEAIVARRPTAWDVFVWKGQASEGHPALPYSPACYPRCDEAMLNGNVGMTSFMLTPHGLRLTSVPLIPMVIVSTTKTKARDREGSWVVTLRPNALGAFGAYGDVTVECGSGRLQHMRDAADLCVCILNYKTVQTRRGLSGRLQVGRMYVCFLLHRKVERPGIDGPTWLKLATDNVLQIACVRSAERTNVARSSVVEDGLFDLPLGTTRIRAPRSQSTILSTSSA